MPRKKRFKHRKQESRAKRLQHKQKKKVRTIIAHRSCSSVTLTLTALQMEDIPSPGEHERVEEFEIAEDLPSPRKHEIAVEIIEDNLSAVQVSRYM